MKFWVIKKLDVIKVVVAVLVLAGCITGVGLTDAAKVFSNESPREMPIHCVDTQDKVVSISFDADWGTGNTRGILKTLQAYDICANFFVTGAWAEKYPEELKELADSGHVEIGTLGTTYANLPKLGQKQSELEITTSLPMIKNGTEQKIELFRAPYGAYSDRLLKTIAGLGLYPIQGSIDATILQELSAYECADRIVNSVKPGSIVLLHSDGKNTVEALPAVIQGLKNKGYSFKTIGDLIYKDNYTIDQTGKQTRR